MLEMCDTKKCFSSSENKEEGSSHFQLVEYIKRASGSHFNGVSLYFILDMWAMKAKIKDKRRST